MSNPRIEIERTKLADALGVDVAGLPALDGTDPMQIVTLRRACSRHLRERHAVAFERAGAASRLLPIGIAAKVAEAAFPARVAAGIANQLAPARAAALSMAMSDAFVADTCEALDPEAVDAIVAELTTEKVQAICRILLGSHRSHVIARFVDAVADDVIVAVLEVMPRERDLVMTAASVDPGPGTDKVVAMISDEQLLGAVRTAVKEDLVDHILAVIGQLGDAQRDRLRGLVTALTDAERAVLRERADHHGGDLQARTSAILS